MATRDVLPKNGNPREDPFPMNEWEAIVRTLAALVAGGAIGLERSYHGRAAGLRTYALVSFGSALLVAGGDYQLFSTRDGSEVTRIIQGIVTGIGFLGAGVIVKEGFSVRGLTTAASIWVASAIGVVLGAGSYWLGLVASLVTLVALTILRQIEDRLPSQTFVHLNVGFDRNAPMEEAQLREMIRRHGFRVSDMAYRLEADTQSLEYRAVIWSKGRGGLQGLEQGLLASPGIVHFRISPRRE
jgi:putative Mg2+ transporter-C (MgtC) family protein